MIDLTARAYDGIDAVTVARAADRRVLAVGQHDDVALRQRALTAGAAFTPYRRLSGEDVDLIEKWISENAMREPAS